MNQAFLRTLTHDILDATCQAFVQTHGVTPDITFYLARSEQEIVAVSQIFPPDLQALSANQQIDLTGAAIRRGIHDGSEPAQAVLTVGEARPRSGRKALLVTLDSPAYTFLLFRYYELRSCGFDLNHPYDIVLLDTVDSSIEGQTEFPDTPTNAATHFYEGLRRRQATVEKEYQTQ